MSIELLLRRQNTIRFIKAKPKTISLTTIVKNTFAGTDEINDGPDRPPQIFRIIYQVEQTKVENSDNNDFRSSFILIGESTASVGVGDHWTEGLQSYVIEWVAAPNGYETKCGGTSFGPSPT